MAYYLFLFAYMFLVQYQTRDRKGNVVRIMVFTLLPLFLFGALRVSCGDYEIYEQYNSWVRSASFDITEVIERMEIGYAYLNKWLPYRWIIVISSFLACYAYGILFVKLIPRSYRWFGIILLFIVADKTFYFMFSSIRNSISISFLMIYMSYRISSPSNNRLFTQIVVLIVITVIASLFHTSAFLFFPITFIATLNKPIKRFEFVMWIVLLGLLWIIPVDMLLNIDLLVSNDTFARYADYTEIKTGAGILAKLGSSVFAVLCLINIRLNNSKGIEMITERLMLLFVYSYMLGSLNMRVSYYFIPFAIVYLTRVYINRKSSSWTVPLLIFAFVFMLYSSFLAGTFASPVYSPFVVYQIALF